MRLHRLAYSCYARYVQAAIELAGAPCEIVDVSYGDREALARLTSGYILVPVLERDDGSVLTDSHAIMATLLQQDARFAGLVPAADAGPIWAYADWANTMLEDVAFRLASPAIAQRFVTAFERALFVLVKERKYGAGCVEQWAAQARALSARLDELLGPSLQTLTKRPFLFGDAPTLADCALYGQLVMLDFGAAEHVARLPEALHAWRTRFEQRLGPPPYGRIAAAHRPRTVLDERMREGREAPRSGKLELIVMRPKMHERALCTEVELRVDCGVAGDRFALAPSKPGYDISLMDARVAAALAERADWPLFGDNLFVVFDLAAGSLRPGDRLALGNAVLELTDAPHHGCRKFAARFGREALLWVNDTAARANRRRGLFVRVTRPGKIALGDTLRRA